jgi:predicted ATPase
MTVRAAYPSMLLPAPPPFTIDVPEGYIAHAAPQALAMLRRADAQDASTHHVTVSSDLVQAGSAPRDLLDTLLGRHDDATTVEEPHLTDGIATGVIARTVAGQPIHQRVTVHVMPTRYAGDVTTALTVVATWPQDDAEDGVGVRSIQDSFSVTGV